MVFKVGDLIRWRLDNTRNNECCLVLNEEDHVAYPLRTMGKSNGGSHYVGDYILYTDIFREPDEEVG